MHNLSMSCHTNIDPTQKHHMKRLSNNASTKTTMSGVHKMLPKLPSGHQPHVPPIAPHEMATMTNLGSSQCIPLASNSILHELISTQVAHTHTVAIPPNECQQHVPDAAPHEVATMATTHAHHDTSGIQVRVAWVLEHLCGVHKDHKESPNYLVVADCMSLLPLLHMKWLYDRP